MLRYPTRLNNPSVMVRFTVGQKIPEIWVPCDRKNLLKSVFPRIVEKFSDPRPDVKQSSAFGRFYQEQPHEARKASREIPSPRHIESPG